MLSGPHGLALRCKKTKGMGKGKEVTVCRPPSLVEGIQSAISQVIVHAWPMTETRGFQRWDESRVSSGEGLPAELLHLSAHCPGNINSILSLPGNVCLLASAATTYIKQPARVCRQTQMSARMRVASRADRDCLPSLAHFRRVVGGRRFSQATGRLFLVSTSFGGYCATASSPSAGLPLARPLPRPPDFVSLPLPMPAPHLAGCQVESRSDANFIRVG